jgi:hypothetical protein
MINSSVLKNVFFQFFSSYFNLLMYAFYQRDFEKVQAQMASIMMSKGFFNILSVTTTNLTQPSPTSSLSSATAGSPENSKKNGTNSEQGRKSNSSKNSTSSTSPTLKT